MADDGLTRLDLPSWYTNPDRWDFIEITKVPFAPQKFRCRSIPAKVTHKLDVKEGKGADGATLNHNGIRPSQVPVTLLIYTGADERRWRQFYPIINPKLNPKGRVLCTFSYPTLDEAKIRDVYVWDIAAELKDNGVLEVRLEALEHLPKKDVPTKPQKKQGDIRKPNAFEGTTAKDSNDVRSKVPSPAKETKL